MVAPRIVTGLPSDVKPTPRSDFKPNEYDILFRTKGYRLYWSSAAICPCRYNAQTEQPDPACSLCKGRGFYYFLPDPAIRAGETTDRYGNLVELNEAGDGVMIQAIMTGFTNDTQALEKMGEWIFGTCNVTTHAENRMGYQDRLVSVDSVITYAQVLEYDGSAIIPVTGGFGEEAKKTGLRYPVVEVNLLRSLATNYRRGEDFDLTADGEIEWLGSAAPAAGTRLSLHCEVHPVWIVLDHPHTFRDTLIAAKTNKSFTPAGEYKRMPVQAVAKLDYLVTP